MSEEKYLIRKQVILDGGLKNKDDETVVVPFSNMDVKVPATFVVGDKVTLATAEEMDALVNSSIAGSHKAIAGEFTVDTIAAAETALALYKGGGDLILNNGRVFNTGNTTPGEVVYFVPSDSSQEWKSEEIIVGATKELIVLSDNNFTTREFASLEGLIVDNAENINKKADTSYVDMKTDAAHTSINTVNAALTLRIDSVDSGVNGNALNISNMKTVDENLDGRIDSLEQAASLDDKVWTGNLIGSAIMDLSSLTDQNGDKFQFTAGKRIEVVMKHIGDSIEEGKNIVVGSANSTQFTIGTVGFTAKLSSVGILTLVKPAGAGAISDFALVRIVEALSATSSSVTYTKSESDAKYATKADVSAIDMTGKQDAIDTSLISSTTKSVVGAINENFVTNINLRADVDEVSQGNFDVFGNGTFMLAMFNADGSISDGFKAELGIKSDAEIDAIIDARVAHALNTAMSVTFDDASTGTYQIGGQASPTILPVADTDEWNK